MPAFQTVRPDVRPVPGDAIVEWCWRAHRAGERKGTKLKLSGPGGVPCSTPTVAINSRVQMTVSGEGDRVRRFVRKGQNRAIPTLEFHQLPRCAEEIGPRVRGLGLRMDTSKEDQ